MIMRGVNVNVTQFSYSRAFGDGPRNLKPRSSAEDNIRAGSLSLNFHTTPTRESLSFDILNAHRLPTQRVFSGTGLELMTSQPRVRYLDH
ncbi:hypothetical protein TNCV_2212041 [Trichonephila clavipes]|nr:hypothetical protein TNCV_2212041 [Trichonephila clavipes]